MTPKRVIVRSCNVLPNGSLFPLFIRFLCGFMPSWLPCRSHQAMPTLAAASENSAAVVLVVRMVFPQTAWAQKASCI